MLSCFAAIPFAFFGLWETTLAVGAAAASIPIIVHLLNRRRFQVVTWAAMRFLLNAQKRNTRRMRLEQLILLALRTLLIILLVIAMASVMPWAENVWASIFPEGAGFLTRRTTRNHKVIVVDASLSMAARIDDKTTCFHQAKEKAIEILNSAQPGDGFNLLLVDDSCTWVGEEISNDASKMVSEIRSAAVTHGNGNMVLALKRVADKLEEIARTNPQYKVHEVYFLTDLQRATWLMGGGKNDEVTKHLKQIEKYAQSVIVDVGKKEANNLAITDLSLSHPLIIPGTKVEVIAKLQHFGTVARKQLPVKLRIGRGKSKAGESFVMLDAREVLVEIEPGQQDSIRLPYEFTKPGTYAVQVQIGDDDLKPDNSRTTIVTVKETIPVLLINGKPAVNRFETATEYLKLALNPFTDGPIPKFIPFRPKVITPGEFGNISENALAEYDAIFLCDVNELSLGQIHRLENHLKRGGGVVISMGKEAGANLKFYNDELYKNGQGLLPAQLLGTVQAPKEQHFGPSARGDAWSAPPLKVFADVLYRQSLMSVRFQNFVQVKPAAGATPFLDLVLKEPLPGNKEAEKWKGPVESPLLVGWQPSMPAEKKANDQQKPGSQSSLYPGKVILMTSTWNMDWNSWAGSPSFIPMVNELTRHAIAGKVQERSALVGQPLRQYLLSGGKKLSVHLYLPDQPELPRELTTEGESEITLFQWPGTGKSGIYRMTVGNESNDFLFAVNPPPDDPVSGISESDLSRITQEELKKLSPDWKFQIVQNLGQIRFQPRVNQDDEVIQGQMGPEIAHYLLLAVLGLLLLEVILAWVFGHFSVVPGATFAPSRIRFIWPLTTGIVAGVLFLGIATVLIHATATGDFLGFLPDGFRSWVEGSLDIPAPAVGEGTKWDLEMTPYLVNASTDPWLAGAIALGVVVLLIFTYRKEGKQIHPGYKVLMGGLRLFVVLLTLAVLLPQLQLSFKRQGWPHVIILIDDSLSMGESDQYQDKDVQKRVASLSDIIRTNLQKQLPERIKHYQQQLQVRQTEANGSTTEKVQEEIKDLQQKLKKLETQLAQLNSSNWRPTRLQLAQALVKNPDQDWLRTLLEQREMKVHIYHLDSTGKALSLRDEKGNVLKLLDSGPSNKLEAVQRAITYLEPHARDTQLGTAVKRVLDQFRGSSVSAMILLTDGITTAAENFTEYEKNLEEVSKYADLKGVPLFMVGIGDDNELRDLKLHDLIAPDSVDVDQWINFQAQLTGKGYKNLTVPIVLKIRENDGTETEVARIQKMVDPDGKPVQVELKYQATTKGRKLFIVEVIPPEGENDDPSSGHSNLKLQKMVLVKDPEESIDVLYVEGGPRYEYRYIKTLLERESKDKQGKKSINLKVFLTEGDDDFHTIDSTALAEFPFDKKQLNEYEVIIFGDVNPRSPKMGEQKLKAIADFVREHGGGLLMLAGPLHNPSGYKDTPLAEVMPVEVSGLPEKQVNWKEGYNLELTNPVGAFHPIFRFDLDVKKNQEIVQKLPQMYWHAQGYTLKPLAKEGVLAVHPDPKKKTPLVVQHFVGAGRCMFFGFDETWRWRLRKDDLNPNNPFTKFWLQTVRYLSKKRVTETTLRLSPQVPFYRIGEKIKVQVAFPENQPPPKQPVKVLVQYTPAKKGADDKSETTMELAKVEGSWATYEGDFLASKEGKYNFRLISPLAPSSDSSSKKEDKDSYGPPTAEAIVIRPPGELETLRMNREEMQKAANISGGKFYTVATASQLIHDLPNGYRVVLNTEGPPHLLWNQYLLFLLILTLLTSEWLLRKSKHLL